jgi:transcriptional regulator GlxA family with amidase domain
VSVQMHDLLNQPTNHFRPGSRQPMAAALPPNEQHARQGYDRRLLLVLMLVENNMQRQLAISDLAAAVNLSSGRLAHLFKSEVGVSLQRYLNDLRMEKARELLENGVLSGKEIAAVVGIPNASRFCRIFKARYGKTPKEYRRTHLRIDLKSIAVSFASA